MAVQMQARSSSNGQLYVWLAGSPDFAAAGYPGPGSALDVAVSMRPSTGGGGGGVTDHGLLTGLTDDDHPQYDLAARPLVSYTTTANTPVLADSRKHILTSNASANTLTIPPNASVAYPAATLLVGTNTGAGTMTLTPGAGVTLNGPTLVVPTGSMWFAKRTATDVWYCAVCGGTAPSSNGGGGMGFRFTYSTTTTDADPGNGIFRANNATLTSVTTLYVDLQEYGGTDVTAWLDSLDDYNGAVKGVVRLQSLSDQTKWIEYTLTAWTTATGYRKLTVAYKDGPGGLTTTAGDTFVSFDYVNSIVGGTSVTVSAAGVVARAALTGDVTASADSNATTIAANAVTTTKIADANVTDAKLALSYVKADGSRALSADWGVGNKSLTGVRSIGYNGEVATTGATPTVDFTTGDLQKTTLSANATPTYIAPAGIGYVVHHVLQNGTGGWTMSFPSPLVGTPPTMPTTANAEAFYVYFWDGSSYHYQNLSHTALSDLTTGDPHTQYALVSGTRAFTGGVTITQAAVSSGSPKAFKVTGGAHTTLTSSTEMVDVDLDFSSGSAQFSTGAQTQLRTVLVRARTYAFVGASTVSDAASLAITGGPVAGTNATITRRWAFWVQGQDTRLDGALQLGAGTYPTGADGTLRTFYGSIWKGTVQAGTSQMKLLEWGLGGVSNNLAIGDGSNTSTLIYGGTFSVFLGSTEKIRISGNTLSMLSVNLLQFAAAGVTNPSINMADDTTGATGQTVTYGGQSNTFAGSTGGQVVIQGTSGAATDGEVSIQTKAGTKRLRSNGTGLGLYDTTPVAQQTRPGQLTDNSGGSAGSTLPAISAAYVQVEVRDSIASLAAKVNAIESKLSKAAGGLGAWT